MYVFFQAEDGIRDLVRSRGLGDVYKRQDDYLVLKQIRSKYLVTYHSEVVPKVNIKANEYDALSLIHI